MKQKIDLNERQRLVVKVAIRYMLSNVDDVNDAFAPTEDEGEEGENLDGKVSYAGDLHDAFTEADVNSVLALFGDED